MGTGRGIADITPLTLLDFPNKVACIFWLGGCNLFCQYCYNVSLVKNAASGTGGRTDYLDFLRDRVGFLDGVVLSGGECTLCPDLIPICREIRQLGFAIKIDTNGTRPSVVDTHLCPGKPEHLVQLDTALISDVGLCIISHNGSSLWVDLPCRHLLREIYSTRKRMQIRVRTYL